MDVARDPAILRRKRLRHVAYAVVALVVVVLVSVALARMEPAAPTVERATLLMDTVKRGSFVRQVRGLGTLVPEDTRWLPATTDGRVERIRLRPGAIVRPDSVILELSNPQVEQEALNARLALQSAEAALQNLRVQLQNDLLTQESQVATIEADYKQAQMDAEANDALAKQQLVSALVQKQSHLRADTLRTQLSGGQQQLVGVARALVANPAVILADEPTGNLHSSQGHEIMELFKTLNEQGTTIVQVTHSETNAAYGSRIIRLRDGFMEA